VTSRTPLALSSILPIALGLALAACAAGGAIPPDSSIATPVANPVATPGPVELTVFGAASLKGVLQQAKTAYEAANPGTTVPISTDSSAALATQIEQGAPADVFLSADTKNPKALADKGLAAGSPVTFAGNELAIIVPADNRAGITSAADLARAGIKIIAAGDEVPITTYAAELVQNLAKEAGYPADYAAACAGNVVSREDNVKALIAKIELSEGDAGIVYATDAKGSSKVTTIDVPAGANVPATYGGVVLKASASVAAATAFLQWFSGAGGQAILAEFGFLPPS